MFYAIYPNNFIYAVATNRASLPRSVQPFVISEEDLLKSSKEKLLAIYNKNCQIRVRDFASNEEAQSRTSQFLTDYFHPKENTMAKRQPNPETQNTETQNTEAAAVSDEASAPKAERTPRVPKNSVIKLLATANPKRSGSAAHTRFALYQDGMTVGQFLDAGGTMADINFDIGKKFIELQSTEAPATEEVAAEASAG